MQPIRTRDLIRQNGPLLRAIWATNRLFCRTYQNVEVVNPCPIPDEGPGILVCNHISGLDPLLLQSTTRRVVVWMMAREIYAMPALNRWFRFIDAIPVNRGGRDTMALRLALRALDEGRILGVFPEGRIAPAERAEMLPFQSGAASMALRTGATVFPAYINGTNRGKDVFPALKYSNTVRIRFSGGILVEKSRADETTQSRLSESIEQRVEALRQTEISEEGRILGVKSL